MIRVDGFWFIRFAEYMKIDRIRLHKYITDNIRTLTDGEYTKADIQRNIETYGVLVDCVIVHKRLEWVCDWQAFDIQHWPKREKGNFAGIRVLRETNDFLLLFKPYNLVVQPGAGHSEDNLVTWLVQQYPSQKTILEEGAIEYANWKQKHQQNEQHKPELEHEKADEDDEFTNGLELTPKMWERNKEYRNNYFKRLKRERVAKNEEEKEAEKKLQEESAHSRQYLSNAWFTAGLVHRIDKETQGLLLVAKSRKALDFYQNQFRDREVKKTYLAVVHNVIRSKMQVKSWQCRDKGNPTRQKLFWSETEALNYDADARYAYSHITPIITCPELNETLVEVSIFTGRTHQIRVQCEALGMPLAGDKVYNTVIHSSTKNSGHSEEIEVLEYSSEHFSSKKQEMFGDVEFCLLANYLEFKDINGEVVQQRLVTV